MRQTSFPFCCCQGMAGIVKGVLSHVCASATVRMIETQHKWAKPSVTNMEAGF